MAKYTRVQDPALLGETYDTFNRELSSKPFISREALVNMLALIAETDKRGSGNEHSGRSQSTDMLPRAAKANPDEFVDKRFLQNLQDQGYFDHVK
jgi:hypothetical protein